MPRRSQRAASSVVVTLLVVLCLGVGYGAQSLFKSVLEPTAEPTVQVVNDTAAQTRSDWYQLYFTTSTENVSEPVVASIASARYSVDAATYEFDLPAMADALIDAHQRGVVVRLVTDTDSVNEEQVQRLIAAGIPVVDDQRSAIMHDKFVIVDGATVWTGSWNFTENDTFRNNNNLIGIASPTLAANYQAEFNEMFERGEFGPGSPADTPNPQIAVNDALIENYFSPDDGVAQHILDAIDSAAQSIYFAAFTFTRADFSQALVDRANAGVTVMGVYETRQVNAGSDESYNALQAAGLPVLLDGNSYTMHHKFIVIDSQIVITGSYNFTKSAEESNDENVLIIHDGAIALEYLKEFTRVWQEAGGN